MPRFEAAIIQRILRDPITDDDEKTMEVAHDLIRDDILTKLSRYEEVVVVAGARGTVNSSLTLRLACTSRWRYSSSISCH